LALPFFALRLVVYLFRLKEGGEARMLARITLLVLFCLPVPLHAAPPSAVDYSKASIDRLIDDLTLIDSSAPGVDSAGIYGGFIAETAPGAPLVGVVGVPPPQVPPQMRELVRRGMAALPALIAHLSDARPTQLAVGSEEFPPVPPNLPLSSPPVSSFCATRRISVVAFWKSPSLPFGKSPSLPFGNLRRCLLGNLRRCLLEPPEILESAPRFCSSQCPQHRNALKARDIPA
jgi:hypothetical protein